MGKQKLRSKDLHRIGITCNESVSISLNILKKYFKKSNTSQQLDELKRVIENPGEFRNDSKWNVLIDKMFPKVETVKKEYYELNKTNKPYSVFGKKWISDKTIDQMDMAMRLPVAVDGALMPDAHVGYGLPIGGVLATENAVIPYAVGLDIGCRMVLTIFQEENTVAKKISYEMKHSLKEKTFFGNKLKAPTNAKHPILDDSRFQLNPMLRKLHGKAIHQLGSSGGGNHFVEWGEVELPENNQLGIPKGKYLGLLSHSGSRGFGATIAQYYTELAMQKSGLPKGAKSLAWLDLDSEEGQEYWLSMNLAGDYAKACHDVIHERLTKSTGLKPIAKIENHHNFAWKERQADGRELIVHRKGATPAKKDELGIIPSSMATACYIVSGKGEVNSLSSASHGSGRKFSRGDAKSTFTMSDIKKQLKNAGVELIGGGTDEAPQAYKDIEQVMNSQRNLVDIVGTFHPKIVKMAK